MFGERFGWVPQAVRRGRRAGRSGVSPQGGGCVWDDGSGCDPGGELLLGKGSQDKPPGAGLAPGDAGARVSVL